MSSFTKPFLLRNVLPRHAGVWGLAACALFFRGQGVGSDAQPPDLTNGQCVAQLLVQDNRHSEVSDASVRVLSSNGTVIHDVRTDRVGGAKLPLRKAIPYSLLVEHPAHVRLEQALRLSTCPSKISITLTSGGRLSGTVLDPLRKPLPRTRVRIWQETGTSRPWEVWTDGKGRFMFTTLPQGPLRLDVSKEGYEPFLARVQPDTPPLSVVLRRAGTLMGQVWLPEHKAAVGATVVVAGSGIWPPRKLETNAAGAFKLSGVPQGVYEVRVTRGEFVAEPREGVTVEPSQTTTLEFQLALGATSMGTVLDAATKRPVPFADVTYAEDALSFAPRTARTDTRGQFRMVGLRKQKHRVTVRARGYVTRVETAVPGGASLTIGLSRAASIAGMVVDEQGRAVPFARVELSGTDEQGQPIYLTTSGLSFEQQISAQQQSGGLLIHGQGELGVTLGAVPPIPRGALSSQALPPLTADVAPLTSDGAGKFLVEGVSPGEVQITVRRAGYAIGMSELLRVRSGETLKGIRVVLPIGGTIDGQVVDARGNPVGSMPVEVRGDHEPVPRTILSGEDGRFRFEHVFGMLSLAAKPDALAMVEAEVSVSSGATVRVTLQLESTSAMLSGRVTDTYGLSVSRARVRIRAEGSGHRGLGSLSVLTGDDGRFTVRGLWPPPYTLDVDHPDYAAVRVSNAHPENGPVNIVLRQGMSIEGTVRNRQTGAPIAGALIGLHADTDDQALANTRTDAQGRFSIRSTTSGNYTIKYEAAGFAPETRPLTVPEHDSPFQRLRLDVMELSPSGSIAGEVVDRYGAPAEGAQVFAGNLSTTTDARGRFVLEGLAPGEILVRARHATGGEAEAIRPAVVSAGQRTPGVLVRLPERAN